MNIFIFVSYFLELCIQERQHTFDKIHLTTSQVKILIDLLFIFKFYVNCRKIFIGGLSYGTDDGEFVCMFIMKMVGY